MSKDDSRTGNRPTDGAEEDADAEAFRRAMADARPLNKTVLEPVRKQLPAKARFTRADEKAVIGEILQSPSDEVESGSGDHLSYYQSSVGGRTFRKLARGNYSVQAECDLHGLNVADARDTLHAFVEDCLRRGHTCVRVVHGKGRGSGHGGPVLKRKVNGWLRQWDKVLAFVSARPTDGGTGALYVLLKRLR
ncbi:MAG: Smr/MutS family protein [Pseudomonadota bacterium]